MESCYLFQGDSYSTSALYYTEIWQNDRQYSWHYKFSCLAGLTIHLLHFFKYQKPWNINYLLTIIQQDRSKMGGILKSEGQP